MLYLFLRLRLFFCRKKKQVMGPPPGSNIMRVVSPKDKSRRHYQNLEVWPRSGKHWLCAERKRLGDHLICGSGAKRVQDVKLIYENSVENKVAHCFGQAQILGGDSLILLTDIVRHLPPVLWRGLSFYAKCIRRYTAFHFERGLYMLSHIRNMVDETW